MKKRFLSVLLTVLMIFGSCVVASASSYEIDFDIDAPTTVSNGDTFSVTVGVDDMKNHVLSATIQLCYDASMLEFVSVSVIGDEAEESSAYFNTSNTDTPGQVIVSFFSIDVCPEDFVRIMTVQFKAKKSGAADLEVLNFNDWSDEYNGRRLWFSDWDGFPAFVNNKKTVSINDYADDYSVNYVIDSPDTVEAGEEIAVSVAVDNMKNHILTYTLEFSYDTDMLEMIACWCPGDTTDGSFYQDNTNDYLYVLNIENDGKVIVAFLPVEDCKTDVVDVVELRFLAKTEGVAEIFITGDEWHDVYNGNTLCAYEGGSYMPDGLETVISVNVEESAPVETVLGDVNGDARITAADARIVLRASARIDTLSPEAEKNADVNKDGKVNASDARMILRVSAKIDDFENPVPPSPPPAPPADTTPAITLKTNMSEFYLDKGGTAVVDIEVIGDLGDRSLIVDYDTSTFRCEWEENWYTYTDSGNDVAVLYVSPLKYTSTKTIKVYVEGYENTIYTTFTVSATEDGWWDYGGYAGAADFGAYCRVAPYFYYMSEDADAVAFYYDLNTIFAAGHTSDGIFTRYFDYLESYGYELVDYSSDSSSSDYTFYNSYYDIAYSYSIMYDDYGNASDIMILFLP